MPRGERKRKVEKCVANEPMFLFLFVLCALWFFLIGFQRKSMLIKGVVQNENQRMVEGYLF